MHWRRDHLALIIAGALASTLLLAAVALVLGAAVELGAINAPEASLLARLANASPWLAMLGGALAVSAAAGVLYAGTRVRPALAVQSAAADAADALESPDLLRLPDSLGRPAEGWNQLLELALSRADADALRPSPLAQDAPTPGSDELSAAFAGAPVGMLVVAADATIRHANTTAAMLLGTSLDDVASADLATLIPDPDAHATLQAVIVREVKVPRSIEIQSHTGNTRLRCAAHPLGGRSGSTTLIVIEDISQQAAARDAQRMFLAHAAHELRTPLTNIRLNIEECVDSAPDDEQTRAEAINVISQESRRLEVIVSDLLNMSEIEAGSLQLRHGDVRIENLLNDLEADFRAKAADKSIKLTFERPAKVAVVRGDREKIELVLHNLVGNALKYTPNGGTVRVAYTDTSEQVRIDVADSGLGIAEDELERIFDRFYRANDSRIEGIEGTGLGLAISRELALLHSGDLVVESQVGVGSTFSFILPRQGEAAKAA